MIDGTKLARPPLIFLPLTALLLAGCGKSTYDAFCTRLSEEDYATCIREPDYRQAYARKRASDIADLQVALLESFPDDILHIDEGMKRTARRVNLIHQIPNIGSALDDDDPGLVGQVFVVQTSLNAPFDSDDGDPTMIFSMEDGLAVADADYLSNAQRDYLSILCSSGLDGCKGDVYLRMTRQPVLDWIRPKVIAVDLPSFSREELFQRRLAFYEGWLETLQMQASK